MPWNWAFASVIIFFKNKKYITGHGWHLLLCWAWGKLKEKWRYWALWWWRSESSRQAEMMGAWLFLLSDVKPSNVLINTLGQVKMCDFGISGYLVDSVAKTIDAGCKPYMAVSS